MSIINGQNTPTTNGPRSYGNWSRPTTPGLAGLGMIATGVMFAGLILTVIMMIVAGLAAAVVTIVIVLGLLALVAIRDKHHKTALSRIAERIGWMSTQSKRAHIYRSGPLGRADWGTTQLPGLAARSRLTEWHDSYQRPFALIEQGNGDFTVVIGTEPDGSALVDQEQVNIWVAEWGLWLANIADEPGLEAVSVTIETAPDTGLRLRREVGGRIAADAPDFAKGLLTEVVDTYPVGSAISKAYVAATFNAASRTGGKKRTADEMGRDLAARLPGLTQALTATGAGAVHPLSAQELCEVVRVAYDPAAAILIDEANAAGEPPELAWPEVGPAATQASWDSYRHDSATSVTWMMTTAPRGNVPSHILARLLAPHRDIARKRVALLYRPIDAARAASIVEADVRAANFNRTSQDRPSARNTAALAAAARSAAEEAAGAGLVNFGILVTATVTDPADRRDAEAAIDNLSATARLRLRQVYGSQDSAFAAALPLGLVLPRHLQIPTTVREQL